MKPYEMYFREFDMRFPSDQHCMEYIFSLRWPDGFICPRCGYNEAWRIQSYKFKCKACGYQVTPTAGTIFNRSHISLRQWLMAAWYLSQNNGSANLAELQALLKIGSYHTVQRIYKKYHDVFPPPMPIHQPATDLQPYSQLHGEVEVTGITIPYRQSYLFVAVAQGEGRKTNQLCIRQIDNFRNDSLICFLTKHVAPGSYLSVDTKVFSEIGQRKRLSAYVIPPLGVTSPKMLDVRTSAEKFRVKWIRDKANAEKEPLSKYLESYQDNWQSTEEKYLFSFDQLIKRALKEKTIQQQAESLHR